MVEFGKQFKEITGPPRTKFVLEFISEISKIKNPRILDIGCYDGQILKQIKRIWPDADIYGIDINKEAILKAARNGQGKFYVMRAEDLKFPSDYFDFCLALDTLEHVSNIDQSLANIHRVLKKRGRFILSLPLYSILNVLDPGWLEGRHKRFEFVKIKSLLDKHNFEIIKLRKYGAIFHALDLWEYLFFSKIRLTPPKIFNKFLELEGRSGVGWWGIVIKTRKI